MKRVWIAALALWPTIAMGADIAGSGDVSGLARVTGSQIIGYSQSDYDAGYLIGLDDTGKPALKQPEGRAYRILYLTPEGTTPTAAARNYVTAIDNLGEVTEDYICRNDACRKHTFAKGLWSKGTFPPTEGVKHPYYLLGTATGFEQPNYRSVRIVAGDRTMDVGVFVVVIRSANSNRELIGRTLVLLDVIEREAFAPSLELIEADEIQRVVRETGRIALYGIQFDTNEATLKPESGATLAEIVKALSADPTLRLYVVGHTDDVGNLEYNMALSERRAQTVVAALTEAGISPSRLTPLGVGPASPVATNASDAGQTRNRRVELVARLGQ